MNGSASWPSIQSLLKMAEKTYLDFDTSDKWVSVEKKARQFAFLIASESKLEPSCWNCGRKGHTLLDCKVERNV